MLPDDILISANTEEEHDRLLDQTLDRLEKAGIKLQQEKYEFRTRELEYLGHRINGTGIHPNEEKVRAIRQAPVPDNGQ